MVALILACEVGFWLLVGGGVWLRYWAGRRRLGACVLALAPATDAVLLAAVAWVLARGGTASFSHGLAVVYLALSVAYGRTLVRWADRRAAASRTGAEVPRRVGREHTVETWRDVARSAAALGLAWLLVQGLTALADPGRADSLGWSLRIVAVVLALDLLAAVSYTVWPRRAVDLPGRARTAR